VCRYHNCSETAEEKRIGAQVSAPDRVYGSDGPYANEGEFPMDGFDKLELSTETIRELSADELAGVAGGAQATQICLTGMYTQSPVCPPGATWYASCELTTFCG